MKIVTIVGARPQFIKAAAVSRVLKQSSHEEMLVHTGQHYDEKMSEIFFEELSIPKPAHNLGIGSGPHGQQTGRMLEAIEKVLLAEKPDAVLVYGDTNSTLAGALAARKLHIRLAHVEAGLRSFNMWTPEEINRILTDRISDLLFCPTSVAVGHLKNEGCTKGVHQTGDVMYDCTLYYGEIARTKSRILADLGLAEKSYVLATLHRPENTDDPVKLRRIFGALAEVASEMPVIVPIHPRTRQALKAGEPVALPDALKIVEPLSFFDMMRAEQGAAVIITDSGGVQKEAFFQRVPCLTLRNDTEWTETVESGWNRLVGADPQKIVSGFQQCLAGSPKLVAGAESPYGDGKAAERIVSLLGSA